VGPDGHVGSSRWRIPVATQLTINMNHEVNITVWMYFSHL
jgi:hypothetical protein